jgi:hypothetical protein
MALSNFVYNGIQLFQEGSQDVAVSLICSALDATAKKRCPKKNNNERNKQFMRDSMYIITKFGMPGIFATGIQIKCVDVLGIKTDKDGYVGIEDIIYHVIRCALVHECDVAELIVFTDHVGLGDFNRTFEIPKSIFVGLAMSTILAPENADERCTKSIVINTASGTYEVNDIWGDEGSFFKKC